MLFAFYLKLPQNDACNKRGKNKINVALNFDCEYCRGSEQKRGVTSVRNAHETFKVLFPILFCQKMHCNTLCCIRVTQERNLHNKNMWSMHSKYFKATKNAENAEKYAEKYRKYRNILFVYDVSHPNPLWLCWLRLSKLCKGIKRLSRRTLCLVGRLSDSCCRLPPALLLSLFSAPFAASIRTTKN